MTSIPVRYRSGAVELADCRDTWEIQSLNKRNGYHFFCEDTMRMFGSRVLADIGAGCLFITSEKGACRGDPRAYTVRVIFADGSTDNIGGFRAYSTAARARRALRNYVSQLEQYGSLHAVELGGMNTIPASERSHWQAQCFCGWSSADHGPDRDGAGAEGAAHTGAFAVARTR